MKLMTGNSNLPLAKAIADYLEIPLTKALVRRFADEEVFVEILENVRGEDVFVLQSTGYPANDNLMELLICIDALKRASAKRITAVVPYFGYARQDRKPGPRTPMKPLPIENSAGTWRSCASCPAATRRQASRANRTAAKPASGNDRPTQHLSRARRSLARLPMICIS